MSRTWYVLLPPSQSQFLGGRSNRAPGRFDERLRVERSGVRTGLERLLNDGPPDEHARALGARGPLLERALGATRRIVDGSAPTLPAWRRYSGVVWSHLDPSTLLSSQRRRLLIPSALYGLSLGTDPVADHRLAMKASLVGVGPLSAYWRASLGAALEEMEGARFINLLPREHDGALLASPALASRTTVVRFVRHGDQGVAGHDAKAVKGVLARRILEEGLGVIEDFEWRGWRGYHRDGHFGVRAPRPSGQD